MKDKIKKIIIKVMLISTLLAVVPASSNVDYIIEINKEIEKKFFNL